MSFKEQTSEATRFLPSLSLTNVNGQQFQSNLDRDMVVRNMLLRLNMNVVATYASGTPVASAFSTMDDLFGYFTVNARGHMVKQVRAHLMHAQQIFTQKVQGERAASAGAAAVNFPTVSGVDGAAFTYGTTGQVPTVREAIMIYFEDPYSDNGAGTCLDLRGVSDGQLLVQQNGCSSLLGYGNTAPVVFSSLSGTLDIIINEWVNPKNTLPFADFRQSTKDQQYSAQQTGAIIPLNFGQKLAGLMILSRDGAAGTTTTATGKLGKDTVITNMELKIENRNTAKKTKFTFLKADNRSRFGMLSYYTSNVSRLDGVAYWDQRRHRDSRTALDLTSATAASLIIDTDTATNVDYTNPVTITVQQDEIARP